MSTLQRLILVCIYTFIFLFLTVLASASEPEQYVYRVFAHSRNKTAGIGTAFKLIYNHRIILISAAHVCELFTQDDTPWNPLIESKTSLYATRVISISKQFDVCIMEAPKHIRDDANGLKLSRTSPIIGDMLTLIGFPRAEFKLIVRAKYFKDEKIGGIDGYQFNGNQLNDFNYVGIPGQSGGVALNDFNQVVGVMVIAGPKDSLIVPLEHLKSYLKSVYPKCDCIFDK